MAAEAFPSGNITAVITGLSFPTSLAFAADGTAFVAESGLPFGSTSVGGRVLAVTPDGTCEPVVTGLSAPVTGLSYDDGTLLVSEGSPGRISRLRLDGHLQTLVDDLPSPGNYHTNMAVAGPDGHVYFSQGAMTNAGVVGLDALELDWLRQLPHAHDLPGLQITLTGYTAETEDPRADAPGKPARTGAFTPFGTPGRAGRILHPTVPCTAAVMRCRPDGTELELVAWGLRNAFGLTFLRDGRLLALDQGADERGSRPIGEAPDLLFEVRAGAWYGWPDFIDGTPVTDPRFRPARGPAPELLIANTADLPPPEQALARFDPHSSATKLAEPPTGVTPWDGRVAVTLFGDERPMTAPEGPRTGRCVVTVRLDDGDIAPLLSDPLVRPIDVGFSPVTGSLHVLDFGAFEVDARTGLQARAETGVLWRLEQKPA